MEEDFRVKILMTQSKPKKLRDKIIGTFVNQLKESQFYTNDFLASLDKCIKSFGGRRQINSIVCYGLGSFCNGVDIAPRYQLALLILLYQQLIDFGMELSDVIEVFDPSFEPLDHATLLSFRNPKFALITKNEYCARKLYCDDTNPNNKVTLVYMPHLDKYFYNNLLGANWSQNGLGSLLVLGNSFQEMIDSEIISSKLKSELYYINMLVSRFEAIENRNVLSDRESTEEIREALVEINIDDSSFEHSDIFNNLAFHLIDDIWLQNNNTKVHRSRQKGWQRFVGSRNASPEDSGSNAYEWS